MTTESPALAGPGETALEVPPRAVPLVPGRTLVLVALVPLALALASLADRSLLWPMLALDAGIAVVAGVDGLWARRRLVTVTRETRPIHSVGQPNPVTLRLRSFARRRLEVQVRDEVYEHGDAPELPLTVTLDPGGREEVTYHVTPHRRGAHHLGGHWVRYRSPLGFWTRQVRIGAGSEVRVYPDVRSVRKYELLARQNREGALLASRRRGGESEFERLREYRREDEYRSIDWKATARRRTLIARAYQLETNQSILFALDAGRLMTAESGGLSLFDHALNATLMLSHVAAKNGDQVGIMSFSDRVRRYSPPMAGPRASSRVVTTSYDLMPELVDTRFDLAFDHLGTRLRKRSLVVLFTQVHDDAAAEALVRLLQGLLPRHLPLAVMLRDTDLDDVLASAPRGSDGDAYLRAAAAEAATWRQRRLHDLHQRGVLLLDVAPQELSPRLVSRYLEIKARHLL